MKILFVEGKNLEPLQALISTLNYPYRLMFRKEQGLYLLEIWGYAPELETRIAALEGFKSWTFDLMETNV